MLSFFVPGLPVAKGRPRFVRATGRAYTPAATVAGERSIAQFAAEAMCGRALFSDPVELRLIACYLTPKTRTKAQRLAPWAGFKGSRPDADNLVKACLDSLNGVVWTDDAIVAVVHTAKVYGPQPGLRISVHPLSPASWPYLAQAHSTPSLFWFGEERAA